ncbi:MAG: glycerol-3-phosphate 1-O-acyltransferase PlsY [Actinobacteria bacterium]|nr:glycerol-3-phosphate 1-O-acyltransferase PlsY [Actinomycetota bacterium]
MWWLLIVPSYFLGTFPSAVMVARSRGIDITKVGSGNPGASNVSRVMGRKWGITVFALDALKGIIPALVGTFVAGDDKVAYAMIAASVLGHMFPVTRRFKGGKGVATMAGAMFVMQPAISAILGVVWIAVLKLTKKSSVASIALIIGLPVLALLFHVPRWEIATMIAINALLLLRHGSNIKRLLRGTELSTSRPD